MRLINTLSLTLAVHDWLADSRQPRILHIFDHACNLVNEHREVLSIVTPQIGNGPFNLVVEYENLFSKYLDIGSPISITENQITVGDLTIDTTGANGWDPCPDWEFLHSSRENILEQLLKITIPDQTLLPDSLRSSLSLALANNVDLSTSLAIAQKLAGLGIGLTPAGDDFLLGAIYAAWIVHPLEIARVMAEEITNTAAPLTTSLSAAWLKAAGKGEAGILWHDFFEALISVDAVHILKTVNSILAVGKTSGADALNGFIGVSTQWMSAAYNAN